MTTPTYAQAGLFRSAGTLSVRATRALVMFIVRDRLAEVVARGPLLLCLRLLALGAVILIWMPFLLALWYGLDHTRLPFAEVVRLVTNGVFAAWLVIGLLGGARLSLQIDLRPLLAMPFSFRTLFAIRALVGMVGTWLLLFAPILLTLAFRAPGGGTLVALRSLAIAVFAMTLNEFVVALSFLLTRAVDRPLSRGTLLLVSVGAIALLTFAVGQHFDASGVMGALETAATRVHPPVIMSLLPPGALTTVLTASGAPELWRGLLLLLLNGGVAVTLSYRATVAFYLVGRERRQSTYRTRGLSGWLVKACSRRRVPASVPLLVAELLDLVRISNLRLLLAFAVPYFVLFPLLLPAADFGLIPLAILMALPFLFLGAMKANVLGISPRTVRQALLAPVPASAVINARLGALNVLITLFVLEIVTVVWWRTKAIASVSDLTLVAGYFAAMWLSTDMLGARFSVAWPTPIPWGRAFPMGSDLSGFIMLAVIVILTTLVAGIHTVAARMPWLATAVGTVALGSIIAARVFFDSAGRATALNRDRDRIFALLNGRKE